MENSPLYNKGVGRRILLRRVFKVVVTLLFFHADAAYLEATTFTAFGVSRQIEESQYVVRGLVGKTWVKLEPTSQRPYTYWNLAVRDTYSAQKIEGNEGNVVMRQPGGELDGLGYRVHGAAEFNEGDDIVVMLRDTTEDAKEVMGLMSGKYNVLRTADGKEYLQNGLGVDLLTGDGKRISPEDFRELVDRVARHSTTEADEKVRVQPLMALGGGHSHDPDPPQLPPSDKSDQSAQVMAGNVQEPTENLENILEENATKPDRLIASQSDFAWVAYAVTLMSFVSLFLLVKLLRRKPKT